MDKHGQGGTWTIIRNIVLVLVILAISFYMFKVYVIDTVKKQSDCEKLSDQGAHCAIVCGPGEEQIPKQCDKKTNPSTICCQDTEYIFNLSEV